MTARRRPVALAAAGLAAAALAGLLGCGASVISDAVPAAGEPACFVDADCAQANYVCTEGVCIVDAPNPVTVSLQVRPPADSGLLPEQFHAIGLSETRRLPDLILSRPVELSGRITVRGNALAASIPARVSLLRRGAIAGTRPRFEADAADGVGYTVALLPGVYDLSVFPENKRFPPFKEDGFQIKGPTVRDVVLPAPEEYLRLTGRVVATPGDAAGLPDLRVQAYTPGRERLSTPAVTDSQGFFELILPPIGAVYTLAVSPTEADPLRPSVTVDGILVEEDLDVGDVALGGGDLLPVQVDGIVLGEGEADPVAGASVEFRAAAGNGHFAWATTADERGRFAARLLPGEHNVRIVPPTDRDRLAVTLVQVPVEARSPAAEPLLLDLHVRRRVPLSGVVTDAAGVPREGVEVQALLTGDGDVQGLVRRVTALTGPGGAYGLILDPGTHDLTLIPPPDSGLPRWVWRAVEVLDATEQDYPLKDADVMSGVLRDPDAKPLDGATVEVYLDGDDDAGDALLIGLGVTGGLGRYTIVLPHP